MALVDTPAILLRSFPFGETSLILWFYCLDQGLVSVIAKGARRKRVGGQGELQTFVSGTLTFYAKPSRDLHTFKDFHQERERRGLTKEVVRFAGASFIGELVMRHAGQESFPDLYRRLEAALAALEEEPAAGVLSRLLSEAWQLVDILGYRPGLGPCLRCHDELGVEEVGRFDFAGGGVLCERCGGSDGSGIGVEPRAGPRLGPRARIELRAFLGGESVDPLTHPKAHLNLLMDFLTYHVVDTRPLQTLPFLLDLLPDDDA